MRCFFVTIPVVLSLVDVYLCHQINNTTAHLPTMIVFHSDRGPTSTVTAATEIWYLRPPSKPLRITWVSERLTLRICPNSPSSCHSYSCSYGLVKITYPCSSPFAYFSGSGSHMTRMLLSFKLCTRTLGGAFPGAE